MERAFRATDRETSAGKYHLATGSLQAKLTGFKPEFNGKISFSKDGQNVIWTGRRGVLVWDVDNPRPSKAADFHEPNSPLSGHVTNTLEKLFLTNTLEKCLARAHPCEMTMAGSSTRSGPLEQRAVAVISTPPLPGVGRWGCQPCR